MAECPWNSSCLSFYDGASHCLSRSFYTRHRALPDETNLGKKYSFGPSATAFVRNDSFFETVK